MQAKSGGAPKRKYKEFTDEDMDACLEAIRTGKLSERKASKQFGISRCAIQSRLKGKHTGKPGRPPVFSDEEENHMVKMVLTSADWGFPFDKTDV